MNLAKIREEKLRFELDRERGKYLLKTDVAVENATKFGAIEAGIKHLMRTRAIDYCTLIGGEAKKANDLIAAFNADVDIVLDQFCHAKGLTCEIETDE